jgi:hypothetical protein
MKPDEIIASQFSNYIYIPNKEIISYYYNNKNLDNIDKSYIEEELIKNKNIVVVPADSNCLIHSILVSLYNISYENFLNIILTLSAEFNLELQQELFEYNEITENYFNKNQIFLSLFAQHAIRMAIRKYWCFNNSKHDYHKNPDMHMNDSAIDGLARNMLCKIFCIPKLIVYQASDDESRKKGIHIIEPIGIPQDSSNSDFFYSFIQYNIDVFTANSKHYDSLI